MHDFLLKGNDNLPNIDYVISGDEAPLNLSGYTGYFTFNYKYITGIQPTTGNATIDDPANGGITFEWSNVTPLSGGLYTAEFLLLSGSNVRRYPQDRYLTFEILNIV